MDMNNNTNLDRKRILDRGKDEFIGICKGIIFDGVVCYPEAVNLLKWLDNNPLVANGWIAKDLYQQLPIMLEGNHLSADDEAKLLSMLLKITGSPNVMLEGDNPSTLLPLCDPPPAVQFVGRLFVLTGTFKLGSRKLVSGLIESMGGKVLPDMRRDVHYLVIGDIGSASWMHSTHGRKIERAVELRDSGAGLAIISEAHLIKMLSCHEPDHSKVTGSIV